MDGKELVETWHRCSAKLLLIARTIALRDHALAEDAVQEAFLSLARQGKSPDDPMAWLTRVTRNQILHWRRSGQNRRDREVSATQQHWFDTANDGANPAVDTLELTSVLESLDHDQRQIIVMHLWCELNFQEIADVMQTSKSTAHRIFQSGIKAMRLQMTCGLNPSSEKPQPRIAHHE